MDYSYSGSFTDIIEEFSDSLGADAGAVIALISVYLVFIGIALLFGLAQYIMNAIAIMNLAKRTKVKNGWLGFIPYADMWMLGRLSDVGSKRNHSGARLLITQIVATVATIAYCVQMVSMVAMSGNGELYSAPLAWIISFILIVLIFIAAVICNVVFWYMAIYRICGNFGGKNSTAYFVGILVGGFVLTIVSYILMLILSTKTPAFTADGSTPQVQPAQATASGSDSVFH